MKKVGTDFVLFTFLLSIHGNVHTNFCRIFAPTKVGKYKVIQFVRKHMHHKN